MKYYKKMDVSDVLNIPHNIDINIETYKTFENLYYDYLNNSGIKLYYKKQDLLEYINENIKFIDNYDNDIIKIEDDIRTKSLRRGFIAGMFCLLLYIPHCAGKDFVIHEQANVKNATLLNNDFKVDNNNDNIPEITTEVLEYIDDYYKPTDDKFYSKTNPAYNLLEKTRVIDNISMIIATNMYNQDIIEIDGEVYSATSKVSELELKDNKGNTIIYKTPKLYDDYSLSNLILKQDIDNKYGKDVIKSINYKGTYSVKSLEEIPTVYRYKKIRRISKTYGNKTLGRIIKKYHE